MSNRTGTSNSKPAVTEAPPAGMWPGRKVISPVVVSSVQAVPLGDGVPATATFTVPATGLRMMRTILRAGAAAIGLDQLKRRRAAVAPADARYRARPGLAATGRSDSRTCPSSGSRRAGRAAPRRNEHGLELGEALDPVAGLVLAPAIGPDRIALLGARAQRNDVGPPLRPAARPERHVGREAGLVEDARHQDSSGRAARPATAARPSGFPSARRRARRAR